MSPASEEEVAAASAYEDLHVPALFQQWAARVADTARLREGDRVRDVACGTGVRAREAATRVGRRGSVAGVDPNPGMLAVAEGRAPGVQWREGVAEALPYEDGSFPLRGLVPSPPQLNPIPMADFYRVWDSERRPTLFRGGRPANRRAVDSRAASIDREYHY